MLTAGQDHDLACAEPLLENTNPGAVIADKAYDADAFIDKLTKQGTTPVIPPKANRKDSVNVILHSIASEISSSVSSTRLSTSAALRRAMINLRETISPRSSWSRPSS